LKFAIKINDVMSGGLIEAPYEIMIKALKISEAIFLGNMFLDKPNL
jgi:hypothetical protein